jgi:hypothetical protein
MPHQKPDQLDGEEFYTLSMRRSFPAAMVSNSLSIEPGLQA